MRYVIMACVVGAGLFTAPAALADNQDEGSTPMPPAVITTAPPPPPGMTSSSQSSVSSSNPGSGCSERLATHPNPPGFSNMFNWYNNGDVGWPFGWPGPVPPNAYPTTPPTVGCSR
jgi:hypothetical protein